MVKKLEYYFEEEDLWFTYEVEQEYFEGVMIEHFADEYDISTDWSARQLVERFIGWDTLYNTYERIAAEDLEREAYDKFVEETVEKISYYLPDKGMFNAEAYEKALGFKVPFEGDIWTTLEVKLERNKIEYEIDYDTEALIIKR